MTPMALVQQDVLDRIDDNEDEAGPPDLAPVEPPTEPETEEPYLAAREAWILLKLTRAMNRMVTDAQGLVAPETYFVLGENQRVRRPDLAFISAERWPVDEPAPADEAHWRLVPDLAVEIVSPTDLVADLLTKIEQYFAAGVRLVWTIHPAFRKVYAYRSPKVVTILDGDDALDGGDVVAGFAMPLRTIFPAPRLPEPATPTPTPPQP